MALGRLYGLGVGPGDPELITIKAWKILTAVPVVAVPVAKQDGASLAQEVVQGYLRAEQQLLPLWLPMTRDKELLARCHAEGAAKLAGVLKEGRDVAFVTLGDVGLYSTFTYLAQAVADLLPEVEIMAVPGITSFAAAAARLNLPLASGDEPLAVVPLPVDTATLRRFLELFPNLVFYKVAGNYRDLVRVLEEEGLAAQAVLASRLGLPGEKIRQGLSVAEEDHDYLSLIIVKRG